MKTLCFERIAALRGTRPLALVSLLSRVLCAARLALHLKPQHF